MSLKFESSEVKSFVTVGLHWGGSASTVLFNGTRNLFMLAQQMLFTG